MSLFLKSQLVLWLIPLVALAVAPVNPVSLCDRFVGEAEQKACEKRTEQEDVDWYAAAACGRLEGNAEFWQCWEKIKNARFNPVQLDRCSSENDGDTARMACIEKSRLPRTPASEKESEFQPLRLKNPRTPH